jgi:hypothetical protein
MVHSPWVIRLMKFEKDPYKILLGLAGGVCDESHNYAGFENRLKAQFSGAISF